MNTVDALRDILFTDLETLKNELVSYPEESMIWKVLSGTTNPAGVLFVHLTRSLRHFIGSSFANTGYLRQREEEFTVKNIPLKDMLKEFETLRSELLTAFNKIQGVSLNEDFPVTWRGGNYYPTHFMLIRMIAHVNYHTGQVNYHRRFFSTSAQQ